MAMVPKGVYCVCIRVGADIKVGVGALGLIDFPEGRYVYVGSALNSLDTRVRRHINTGNGVYNAIKWHIDYLLKEPMASVETVYVKHTEATLECEIAEAVSRHGAGFKGFGCSDCRCRSHLFRVEEWAFLADLGMVEWGSTGPS